MLIYHNIYLTIQLYTAGISLFLQC